MTDWRVSIHSSICDFIFNEFNSFETFTRFRSHEGGLFAVEEFVTQNSSFVAALNTWDSCAFTGESKRKIRPLWVIREQEFLPRYKTPIWKRRYFKSWKYKQEITNNQKQPNLIDLIKQTPKKYFENENQIHQDYLKRTRNSLTKYGKNDFKSMTKLAKWNLISPNWA